MRIIVQDAIIIFSFDSTKEMRELAGQIKGQAEWAEENDIKPPFLYSQYTVKGLTPQKTKEILEDIKERFS